MTQSAFVLDSAASQVFARLEEAAHEAATSPWNKLKAPSRAQMVAVNWKHGPVLLRPGLRVKIENPRGTFRSGKTPDGIPWENRMGAHYGDIVGTKGADGDPVDIFIGMFPESPKVWVINQRQNWPGATGFDEHKVMTGFLTEEQARSAYLSSYQRGWNGLESMVPCTYEQLKWWLRYGDTSAPFTTENLPYEGTVMLDTAVQWNEDAQPVGIAMHELVYKLRREDTGAGLLLDAVTMTDLMTDPDIEGVITLDALVIEVSRMTQKLTMLQRVMESAGDAVKPTEFQISDPVRARGVLQVMVLIQMSDGQTVSIWFHNPDTTPAKLTPLDELISWKWMLNKKDVTIVVAPERGQELNIREVSRRIMRLVERNSDTFKRANEKAAAKQKEVAELRTEIVVLEVELADWQRKIEVANMEAVEAPTPKERWDSARGYVKALLEELRKEVATNAIADRRIVVTDGYGNAVDLLKLVEKLANGEVTTETPEGLRSSVEAHAIEIRTQLAEASKIVPAPTPAPAAAPEPAGSPDAVLAGLGVRPDDIAAISDDGGYAAVAADEKLSLKWQDVLDSAMQQRLVDVRNALRTLGWSGKKEVLMKDFGRVVHGMPNEVVSYDVKQVGAGANIVGITWVLNQHENVPDTLSEKAADLAARLDGMVGAMVKPEQAAPAAVEDTMGTLPAGFTQGPDSIATNPDPVTGGIIDTAIVSKKWFVIFNSDAIPKSEAEYDTRAEAIAAFQAGIAAAAEPAEAVAPKAISDAELQAAAEAGAEVRKISRNLADPATKDMGIARATLSTDDGKHTIFLYTEADVTRAVKAVHDAEEMSHFRPFDPSTLKLPTAVQLGLNQRNRLTLIVSDQAVDTVLDGWSNGHLIDLIGRPGFIKKAVENYAGLARRIPMSAVEKVETSAKGRATKVLPISHYDYEQVNTDPKAKKKGGDAFAYMPVNSLVLESADGKVWVWLDTKYVAYFWKTFKGCEFFADGEMASVAVRQHGKLVGIIMPMNAKGDTSILTRAKRVTAKAVVEKSPDELSAAQVDAAYQFTEATEAFKIAIAHSVGVSDYSPFATARAMDERAKALGLTVAWDVESVVLDSVPLPGFDEAASENLFGGRRERVLDALVVAAAPYLPAGAMLDFVGDVSAAVVQLEIALDVCVTNEPINRERGNIAQADLEASNAAQFRSAIQFLKTGGSVLDDAGDTGGEEWETVVGRVKRDGQVIGRAVVADGDGKAMVYLGEAGKERVTYVSPTDGVRRTFFWSDDDAVMMIDALVENIAAVEAAAAAPAPEPIAETAPAPEPAQPAVSTSGALTDAQMVVLLATGGYKSGYRLKNAMSDTGISQAEYEAAAGALNASGLYLRRNAITDAGTKVIRALDVPGAIGYSGKLRAFKGKFGNAPAATGGGQPPADPPAAAPVEAPEPERGATSEALARAYLAEIAHFMPRSQVKAIESGMRGEEKQYFFDKLAEMRDVLWNMPKTYDQDGKGGQAIAYLHYFFGSMDFYITERDQEWEEQAQAFGLANLGQGGELGYISIIDITRQGVELDLHWTPKTIDDIQGVKPEPATEDDGDTNIGKLWRSPSGVVEITGFKDGRYTTMIDDERPGLPIDPDDLEQTIRDDKKAVEEAELAAALVRRDAQAASAAAAAAGGAELEAAGFNRIGDRLEFGKSVQVSATATARFNVRRVGGSGYAEGWKVIESTTFNNGVTGAPSQDLGLFNTPGEAIAAVDAVLAKFKAAAEPAKVEPVHNQLRPLAPQSPDRAAWEGEVARIMTETLEVTNGDAQGMMEAVPDDLDAAFARGDAPAAVVAALWPVEAEPAAAPAADPAKDADRAYLGTLIAGTADMLDPGILDKLEPMFVKYDGDAEMVDLLTKAADAYSNAAVAAAKQALS